MVTTYGTPSRVAARAKGRFASSQGAALPNQSPFQPLCATDAGDVLPPPGSFAPDIWNTCPGHEANRLTAFSRPSTPTGVPYTRGARTSGILLPQTFLESPVGEGLPFPSSYSVQFPDAGTYAYACAIHQDMTGVVVVTPRPVVR